MKVHKRPLVSDFFHLMFSSFINASFCFTLKQYSIVWITTHFVHLRSLLDGWFALLDITHNAVLIIRVAQIVVWTYVFTLGYISKSELMGPIVTLCLTLRNWQTVFQSCSTIFKSHQQCMKVSIDLIAPCQHLLLSLFLMIKLIWWA